MVVQGNSHLDPRSWQCSRSCQRRTPDSSSSMFSGGANTHPYPCASGVNCRAGGGHPAIRVLCPVLAWRPPKPLNRRRPPSRRLCRAPNDSRSKSSGLTSHASPELAVSMVAPVARHPHRRSQRVRLELIARSAVTYQE